jgi:hypothetical protein
VFEAVIPVLLSIVSSVTAVVTTVGLSKPARIRHELKEVSQAIAAFDHDSAAFASLARFADIRSAELVAGRLVRHDLFLGGASAIFIVGGLSATVIGHDSLAAVIPGLSASALGYLIAFTHVSNVERLRRRQVRAILARRPSGLLEIKMGIPMRRDSVRRDVFHPEEYPFVPWLFHQFESTRTHFKVHGRMSGLQPSGSAQ